jgi:hypothetical protein
VTKVPQIPICPYFRVQFALRTTFGTGWCPYFTVCPHFEGLLFTGFTVSVSRNIHVQLKERKKKKAKSTEKT